MSDREKVEAAGAMPCVVQEKCEWPACRRECVIDSRKLSAISASIADTAVAKPQTDAEALYDAWQTTIAYMDEQRAAPPAPSVADAAAAKRAKDIESLIDEAMTQAQVFASAWSLIDGPFGGTDDSLENAEVERRALRALIGDLLTAATPAPSVADAAGASERRFEIRQGGMTVAATEGPGADAYRDAVHYFWQYQQDATEDEPVEMVELTTVMRIDAIAKESGND